MEYQCIDHGRWQAVGFVHGVLNTDNMSIMGLTIDYGPFAFEEHFDPDFTPNGSDGGGRYTYAFQPSMCKWNLNKLAEQLSPLIPLAHSIEILNREWDDAYEGTYSTLMHQKLGLLKTLDGDKELIEDYFTVMSATRTDFTDSFQALTDYSAGKSDAAKLLDNLVSRGATPVEKIAMMRRKMKIHRLGMQPSQIQALWDMIINKPNEVTEMFGGAPIEAIKSEIEGEMRNLERQSKAVQEIKRLETNVSAAQKADEDRVLWAKWLEKYHTRLSLDGTDFVQNEVRVKVMKEINPTFVLRNWIAQDAIAAAEKGNYEEVSFILSVKDVRLISSHLISSYFISSHFIHQHSHFMSSLQAKATVACEFRLTPHRLLPPPPLPPLPLTAGEHSDEHAPHSLR